MSVSTGAKLARNSQRLYLYANYSYHQQHQRQLSFLGDFFKRVKSEAGSNEELQKAVNELKKTGDAVRERAKAASKVVGEAAAASTEAARAAAQQAQRHASEVSTAVRQKVAQQSQEAKTPGAVHSTQSEGRRTPEDAGPSSAASTPPLSDHAGGAEPRDVGPGAARSASHERHTDASSQHQEGSSRTAAAADSASAEGAGASEDAGARAGHQGADTGAHASSAQRFGAASFLGRIQRAADVVRREVVAAVLPDDSAVSATRAVEVKPQDKKDATTSALATTPVSRFQQHWQDLQDKLGLHPIFQRIQSVRDTRLFTKGREMAEDMRERWETSDSAMVQRIQTSEGQDRLVSLGSCCADGRSCFVSRLVRGKLNAKAANFIDTLIFGINATFLDMKESMFSETEMAAAFREIRARDPRFDMVLFLQRLKKDVPVVIKGSLEGNASLLKQHCAPEMVERFSGIYAAQQAQGKFFDSTILDWSDVELVDLKFLESHPVVLVQFTVQQLNCIRDSHGNIVEGDPNSVQRVYYYWALQQDTAGFVGVDGKAYPPRWQLREQVVRAMHNLL